MVPLKQEALIKELEQTDALLNGHFLLSSGLHSPRYLQCARLLQYPNLAEMIGKSLAVEFAGLKVDFVAAPAIGGIIVAHEVARALGVRAVFSERENGNMTFRRGLEVKPGERAIVVEDVITTGGSIKETVEAVKQRNAEVVGLGCIVDRSGGKSGLEPFPKSLLVVEVPTYSPQDCPDCAKGIPVVKPGSREFPG